MPTMTSEHATVILHSVGLPSLKAAFIATIQEAGHLPYADWETS